MIRFVAGVVTGIILAFVLAFALLCHEMGTIEDDEFHGV